MSRAHLESCKDDDPELPDALRDFYQPIAKQLITADLSQQVLDTIQQLTVRDLPDLTSAVKASEFSKQFLREQSAWLDMLFLWWYKHPATGPQCASLLTTIHQTEFGNKQAHMGFWDPEATHQAKVVKHAFVLVSLVALNLESFATTDGSTSTAIPYQSQALPDQIELLHPDTLKAVHAQVISLAQGFADFSAPLVLGWSHILCCLTEGLQASQEPVKSEYAQFVDELTQGDQPLWQRLLSHVLPRLFACLSATLSIALTSTPEPLGALSVLRTPLAILPTMVELSFLPEPHLIAMNDFAVQLFSHPEAQILRHQFWANKLSIDGGEDAAMLTPAQDLLTIGQERAFDFHARRFPLHPLPFLRLLRGLSGSPQSAEAEWATLSLRQLPCITCLVPTSPIMRPYDIDPSDSQRIVVAHPNGLRISKSVVLPVGTSGWLLSEINGPKAVARFELPEDGWNAWLWIQDVLEQYASTYLVNSTSRSQQHQTPKKRAAPHDPFSTDSSNVPAIEFDSDKDADHAAAAALDLLAKDMLRDASSLKSPKAAQDCANMLFAVLEKALFTKAQGVSAAALRALKALLPAYPGMVWSLIRAGKADLFTVGLGSRASRGGTALLAADRSSGTYDSLFALLNLVQALVEETRLTVVDDDYLQVKAEVLSHAFTWLLEEVLTAGFGSWRFQDGKARWQLAKLLLDVFATVAEDALLGDHGHLGGAAEILLSPLLTECTSSNGDCIMPIIGILAAAYDGIVTGIKAAVDAGVCRSALRCSLQLILQLLFLRKHRMPQKPSLLERALISTAIHSSKPGRSTSRAPIATLFACCLNTTALHFSISELAAQVLTTVALFVTDFRHTSLGMQTLTPIFSNPEEQSHQLFNVANDSHAPITLRIAVWQLMTALMDTQPAVTMLFALGRLGPPDAEIKIDKSSAVTPSQHTNNVRRSVEVVKSADELPPEILQAVLSFIESTWERVQDFPAVMQPLRDDEDLWKVIIRLSTSPIPPAIASTEEPDSVWVDEAATGQCYRTLARATATRLVCADLTARLDSNAQNANNAPSFALLLPILKQSDQLSGAYLPTLTNDADIPLHADLQVLLKARFPSFDFASVRRASPLGRSSVNVQRKVGTSYLYDAELATRRMRSCTNVEYDADEILEQLLQINLNWSFIDSQLAVTRAWKDLLGTAYPYSRAFAENESKLVSLF